jgi:acyl carrier protein
MSHREKVRKEVIEIVADIAELSPEEISSDASLEDLGIDSLNGLRLVAEVEKRYDINIPDDAIGKIRTIPEIFALVDAHEPED